MRKIVGILVIGLAAASLVPGTAVAGGGAHCEPHISDQRTNVVTMAKNCFHPTVARVGVGDQVTFVSEDPVPHTVTGAVFAFGDTDELLESDRRAFRFDEEGIYPYVCIIHPGMMGAIVVGDGKGPGDGAIVETSSYVAPMDEADAGTDDGAASETTTEPVAATDGSQWPLAVALVLVLTVAAFVGTRRATTPSDEGTNPAVS